MSKKTKKSTIRIEGTEYKVVQWTNSTETNLKYLPQNPPGVISSGLHIPEKNKDETHWDYYDGKKKIKGKKYVKESLKFPPIAVINFKEHLVFSVPPGKEIMVLRGSDKSTEFISLEYYRKHRDRYLSNYFIRLGDEENPQVLEIKPDAL